MAQVPYLMVRLVLLPLHALHGKVPQVELHTIAALLINISATHLINQNSAFSLKILHQTSPSLKILPGLVIVTSSRPLFSVHLLLIKSFHKD